MKKTVLPFFLFLTFLFAEGTYSGVYFTDIEENMTLLLVNHADYNTLYGILRNSTDVNNILNERFYNRDNGGIISIKQLDDIRYISDKDLYKLKQYSYKWTADIIIDPKFGTTYPQTNFLYGLSGILIGFIVMFGFIRAVT
ncbi:hypothetical protein [Nautilia sp.]